MSSNLHHTLTQEIQLLDKKGFSEGSGRVCRTVEGSKLPKKKKGYFLKETAKEDFTI